MPWISRKDLAEEREKDRQTLLTIVQEISAMSAKQLAVLQEQLQAQNEFLGFFQTESLPTSRTLRDEDEWAAEQERTQQAQWKLFGERES